MLKDYKDMNEIEKALFDKELEEKIREMFNISKDKELIVKQVDSLDNKAEQLITKESIDKKEK